MSLRSFILRPLVFHDEGKTRTAALLHFILVFSFLFNLFGLVVSVLLNQINFASISTSILSMFVMGGLFALLRRGNIGSSSLILSLYSWVVVSYEAYHNTGILNPVYSVQSLTILMAGLLLNGWAAVGFALISSLFGLLMLQSANLGMFPQQVGGVTAIMAWIYHTMLFGLTALFLSVGLQAFHTIRQQMREQERALSKSEKRYRSLVENASDIVFSIDRDHRLGFLNRASVGSPGDYQGRSIYDFLSAQGKQDFEWVVKQVFDQGSEEHVETQIKSETGQDVQYSVRLAPIREGKEVVEIIAVARDITKQTKAREALLASEDQYRQLFETNPHPMFVVDIETGRFLAVNDVMVQKYGYARDEFLQLALKDILVPNELNMALARRQAFAGGNRDYEMSGPWHHRKKDGSIIQVEISTHRLDYNGRKAMMTAAYDVTEREQAETALRASEERFRTLIEESAEVVGILGRDGTVKFISSTIEQMMGYEIEEILGEVAFKFLYKDDVPLVMALLEEATLHPIEPQEGVYRVHRKNGSLFTVEVVIRDMSHIPTVGGIVFNVRDITERQRTEEAMRSSQERFRALIEKATDVVGVIDPEGIIKFVSPSIQQVTGRTPDELIGASAYGCVYPDDHPILRQLIQDSIQHPGEIQTAVFRDQHIDGSIVLVEATSRDMTKTPAINGIIFNLQDITERKRAEDALRASEAQYRQLFDANPHPMYVLDMQTLEFLDVNDATLDHYGYARDEFLRLTTRDIRPPEDMSAVVEQISKFQRNNLVYEVTGPWQHRKKDGSIIQVETAAHRLRYKGRDAVLIAAYDLTDRLRAEDALRRSEQLFSTIFHAVPVSILMIRQADTRVINVNDYLLSLTGYSRREIIDKKVADIPVWEESGDEVVQAMIETQILRSSEFVWVTRSGERLSMVSSFQQVDMNGEPCLLGVLVDLTERNRAEAARLEAERMRLEIYKERDVVELKERFISTMSHEFRTPLAIILAAAESLHRYYDRMKPERREEHFYNITNQMQYVTSMLDEVLTLSKARSGKTRFNPSPIDFVTFCQHLFEQVQLTDTHNHRFTFTHDDHVGELRGDEYLLQHILINLLSNAIKYSPEGGEVHFSLSRKEDEMVIEVSDEGIGIPEEDQKYLFDAFYRASNTQSIKGTGLGLAIVKESVDAHGGTITCKSAIGEGTTFTVRLPVQAVDKPVVTTETT